MEKPQPPSPDMQAIVEWLRTHVQPLLSSGETCTVTLHIGQGDIRAHVERKYMILPPRRYRKIDGA